MKCPVPNGTKSKNVISNKLKTKISFRIHNSCTLIRLFNYTELNLSLIQINWPHCNPDETPEDTRRQSKEGRGLRDKQ